MIPERKEPDPHVWPVGWMSPGMVLVDVETTGLEPSGPRAASLIEICAVAWTGEWVKAKFRPWPGCYVDGVAVALNGHDLEDLDAIPVSWWDGVGEITRWLNDMRERADRQLTICGMNPHFDMGFLDVAWERRHGSDTRRPWSHRVYDLHTLATSYLSIMGELPPKLHGDAIATALGITQRSGPHTAEGDCAWECAAFYRIHTNLKRLQEVLRA